MSCPKLEIGSCISLIAKADTRYKGLLFTVDPDPCSTPVPLPYSNQCYDYIGSDIKDIHIINNNPMPNDPVIMQMHLPPQQSLPPMQSMLGQPGFQSQMMPPIGPGPMGDPPPSNQPIGQPYSSFGGLNNFGESDLDLIGGGAEGAGFFYSVSGIFIIATNFLICWCRYRYD